MALIAIPKRNDAVPRSHRSHLVRKRLLVAATALPAVIALAVVLAYPIAQSFQISLSNWEGVGAIQTEGFSNYLKVFSDPDVRASLLLTVVYALSSAFGIVALASLLASSVSRGVRGSAFYRVVWFLPSVAPVTAVSVFWSNAFQPTYGAANALLGAIGLGNNHAWLADSDQAIYPVIFVTIWAGVGFAFLLILGGMEQVDVAIYEAARVDGAGPIRQFFSLTLPLIRPVIVTTSLLEVIWAANNFTVVWSMTNGGPGNATSTLPVLVYVQAFNFNNFGLASAIAVVSGIILLALGAVGLRISRERGAH
jgi:raffinose/stachyose/melibiose transport system permease protein